MFLSNRENKWELRSASCGRVLVIDIFGEKAVPT